VVYGGFDDLDFFNVSWCYGRIKVVTPAQTGISMVIVVEIPPSSLLIEHVPIPHHQ
jgi:hypothetical protein